MTLDFSEMRKYLRHLRFSPTFHFLNIMRTEWGKNIERILDIFNRTIFSPSRRIFYLPQVSTEILMYDDEDFRNCFNMKRSTFRCIVRSILRGTTTSQGVRQIFRAKTRQGGQTIFLKRKQRSKLPLTELLCLCMWFLSHPKSSLREMAKMFKLLNAETASCELERGFKLIAGLGDHVVSPSASHSYHESAKVFKEEFGLNNVVGCIGHRKFSTEDKNGIIVHGICNEQFLFTTIDTTPNIDIGEAIEQSKLMPVIKNIPKKYCLVGDFTYNLLRPYGADILTPDMEGEDVVFETNKQINTSSLIIDLCFQHTLKRFPRLRQVHKPIPEIFLSALVMHNFMVLLGDYDGNSDTKPLSLL